MTDHLDVLLADGVIDEVLGRLKSGKEANISLVRRGDAVLAAKVYKDRSTRSFKNNADYKEGRKVRNSRTQRAMDSGGRFGRDAAEQAWKSAEADALYKLVGSGVRVPTPVMFYEGVLLMELVKDAEGRPAPRMIDVAIEPAAAIGVYADLLAQVIAMLCCDLIHGDLSPYNILAAADGPTIIDFPQVVSAVHSSRAEFFFLRDFDNVVRFISGFDPALAVHRHDGRAIWRAYVGRELTRDFVPPPPPSPGRGAGPNRWRDQRSDARPDPRRTGGSQRDPRWSNGGSQGGAGGPNGSRQGGESRWQADAPRSPGAPHSTGSDGPDARPQQGGDPRWQADPPRSSGPQSGRPGGPEPRRPSDGDPRWQADAPRSSGTPQHGGAGGSNGSRSNGSQGGGPGGSNGSRQGGDPRWQADARRSNAPQSAGPGGATTRRYQRDPQSPSDTQRSNGAPQNSGPGGPNGHRRSDGPPPAPDRGPAPQPPRAPQREWSAPASSPSSPASPSRGGRRRPKRHW